MTKVAIAILHGFNSSKLYMKGIEYEIRKWEIFDQVLNLQCYSAIWGLISTSYNYSTPIIRVNNGEASLENTVAGYVLQQLKDELDPDIDELFLLGHSMGGLVWRALLKGHIMKHQDHWLETKPPQIKAVIQLASPNQGSQLANMRLIEIIDKIQSTIFLKVAGYSLNLIKRIGNKIGLSGGTEETYEVIQHSTQLAQLKPNSRFIKWLNEEPTYVDKIPHYRVQGTRNGIYFTNLAWINSPDELDPEELIEDLKDKSEGEDIQEIMNKYRLEGEIDDLELDEIIEEIEHQADTYNPQSVVDQIMSIFDSTEYVPNDGLVSINDAYLDGSIKIDLGQHQSKISHWSICMWFLPFEPYQKVRDEVKNVIKKELNYQT